jgi:3-hydroxyisobutyrate dehydrogenase-like beta-hydroxyacid dehydrogenase
MPKTKPNIGFIGLGIMGRPMARNLIRAGYRLTVWNRSAQGIAAMVTEGATAGASARDVAEASDVVITMVGYAEDVEQVALGAGGIVEGAHEGLVHIDMSTIAPDVTRRIATRLAESGVEMLDAPVSGGEQGAIDGTLSIMVGGDEATFARAEGVLAHYARAVTLMGPSGAGQLTKMVNQICIAGLVQALAEGIDFATRAGLDPERVLDVISKGAAQSWQMENRGKTMVADKFDFGFAVDWMRKDLGICLDEARNNGATLPVTSLVDQFYGRVQQRGGGRWDTSSLIRLLRNPS